MKRPVVVTAIGLIAAAITACSDSAVSRSLTAPSTLAPGGVLRVETPATAPTTLTFDDITNKATGSIHPGYGGGPLRWPDFSVVNGNTATVCTGCQNGYANGSVSGDYVAYRQDGGPTPPEVTIQVGTFDFISVYLTRANDRFVQVTGYTDGVLVYDQTVALNLDFTPALFTFNYVGVDRVVFRSFGGTGGYSPLGDTFAMDDFTYSRNLPAK